MILRYTDCMDAALRRPWYRLHWGTVLVVVLVGLAWSGQAFPLTIDRILPSSSWFIGDGEYLDGWPMLCIRTDNNGTVINALFLTVDLAFLVSCLASVAFVTERLERGGTRFGISTILTLVAVVAVLCGLWRWDRQWAADFDPFVAPSSFRYYSLSGTGLYILVPVMFAIGCLIYMILLLAQTSVVRFFARLRRSAPAKIEADGSPVQ